MRAGFHRFHGLNICCNHDLARLPRADTGPCDLEIEVLEPGRVPHPAASWVMTAPPHPVWRARTARGALTRLRYEQGDEWAEYVIDERGQRVWIGMSESTRVAELAELLIGPVFSCVLARRGRTCLHASVIRCGDRTVAFVGPSGAGKSTTAVAMVDRGGVLISDDVAAVMERDGRFTLSTGTAEVRMRPEPAEALVGGFDTLEPIWAQEHARPTKRYAQAERADPVGEEHALGAVYLLGRREPARTCASVVAVDPVRAVAQLMTDRHMAHALDLTEHARDFELLARLSETIPVREVIRPDGLKALPSIVAAIRADVSAPH